MNGHLGEGNEEQDDWPNLECNKVCLFEALFVSLCYNVKLNHIFLVTKDKLFLS